MGSTLKVPAEQLRAALDKIARSQGQNAELDAALNEARATIGQFLADLDAAEAKDAKDAEGKDGGKAGTKPAADTHSASASQSSARK